MTGDEELVRDGLVTIGEAMEFLDISRAFLYRLIDEGALPTVKLACARRVPRRALVRLASSHHVGMQDRSPMTADQRKRRGGRMSPRRLTRPGVGCVS